MAGSSDSRARKILVRTLVGGGLALVLALALWWVAHSNDGGTVVVVGWVLSALAVFELHTMGAWRPRRLGWVLLPGLVATAVRAWDWDGASIGAGFRGGSANPTLLYEVLVVAVLAVVTRLVLTRALPARSAPAELLALAALGAWTLLPLPWLGEVWWAFGVAGLVALLILSKIGDIAGYYVGNALGRSHPFPKISPGKTTAGCVGSLVTGIVAGGACVAFGLLPEGRFGVLGGCLAGLVINLAAQSGDLFESWIKRRAGVKDSGTWFGPSGGVLDLVDSLLFTVPVALLLWPLLFPGGWFPDGQMPILPPSSG